MANTHEIINQNRRIVDISQKKSLSVMKNDTKTEKLKIQKRNLSELY